MNTGVEKKPSEYEKFLTNMNKMESNQIWIGLDMTHQPFQFLLFRLEHFILSKS